MAFATSAVTVGATATLVAGPAVGAMPGTFDRDGRPGWSVQISVPTAAVNGVYFGGSDVGLAGDDKEGRYVPPGGTLTLNDCGESERLYARAVADTRVTRLFQGV